MSGILSDDTVQAFLSDFCRKGLFLYSKCSGCVKQNVKFHWYKGNFVRNHIRHLTAEALAYFLAHTSTLLLYDFRRSTLYSKFKFSFIHRAAIELVDDSALCEKKRKKTKGLKRSRFCTILNSAASEAPFPNRYYADMKDNDICHKCLNGIIY